jgi:hypothetical protein
MSLADLRVTGKRYGVKTGGIKKQTLKRRVAKAIKETETVESSDPRVETYNDPTGSQTVVQVDDFKPMAMDEDQKFQVTLIDRDIEPHKKVDMEVVEGQLVIQQTSFPEKEKETMVLVMNAPLYDPEKDNGDKKDDSPKKYGKPHFIKKVKSSKTLWNPNTVAPPTKTDYLRAKRKSTSPKEIAKNKASIARIKAFEKNKPLYDKKKLMYFYQATLPRGANKGARQNDLVPMSDFDNMQEAKFLIEKEEVLEDADITFTRKDVVLTGGNELQSSFDDELNFVGLFDQRISKKGEWIPHFATGKDLKIVVDDDGAGNYMAYMNNLYAYNDPMKENMYFPTADGSLTEVGRSPDLLKVYRFWGSQLANSAAHRRNRIIPVIVSEVLKPKESGKFTPLKYRTSLGSMKDFNVTDQSLKLADFVYDPDATLEFHTAETMIEFEFEQETDLSDSLTTDSTVVLEFIEDKEDPQFLTSDLLVSTMVKEHGLDPVAAQVLLENLYQQGWIDYPRKSNERARTDPVKLKRDLKNFRGTAQEREMLTLVHKATEAKKQGKNFILKGNWIVSVNKEKVLVKPDTKTVLIPDKYSSDQFDVRVNRDGRSDDAITEFMQTNQIGTPATRMVLLANMKEAGILTKINNRYVLDARGIVLASTYQHFEGKTFNASDLAAKINTAEDIDEIEAILSEIKPIPRESTIKSIKEMADPRIEAQKDIAVLDTF